MTDSGWTVDGVPVPLDDDHYITGQPVKHLRLFDEGDGWAIDGSDGAGNFTREIWKWDTREETLSHKQEFIKFLREQNHTLPEGEIEVMEEPEGGGPIL
jgi:hypothetical protein